MNKYLLFFIVWSGFCFYDSPSHATDKSDCPDHEKIYPKHPSIRHLVENKSVQAVNGLRFFLLPPCETPLLVRDPSKSQHWHFRILFQNTSKKTIKVPRFLAFSSIGPVFSNAISLQLILDKNGSKVFDTDYYQTLVQSPPKVNIQSIPTPPPPPYSPPSDEKASPHSKKYKKEQTFDMKKIENLLYESIPPRHISMQLLSIPNPSVINTRDATDPVSLAFLYRFHHIAFPYNYPAHYKMQLIFHREADTVFLDHWSGTITSNSITFETVSAKQ